MRGVRPESATVKGLAGEAPRAPNRSAISRSCYSSPGRLGDGAFGDATEGMVKNLIDTLESGDIIIDGGNSYYKDDVRRAKLAAKRHSLRGCRNQRGVWASSAATADDWRRERNGGAP